MLFIGGIIVYVENYKESAKQLIKLISGFNSFAEYNFNTHNSNFYILIVNDWKLK